MSRIRSYKYACGANCYITINNLIVNEAAMIEWNLYQNKLPLYGYNAARFSNIADGQTIVKGTLVLNHVGANYLTALIAASKTNTTWVEQGDNDTQKTAAQEIQDKINTYWSKASLIGTSEYNGSIHGETGYTLRPDQHNETVTINVYVNGRLDYKILNVSFISKGQTITNQNDGSIKEVYSFIAREIF